MAQTYSSAYLEALGLDPRRINSSGYTDTTYQEFGLDPSGRVVVDPDGMVRVTTRAWPDNFNADVFRYLRRKDGFTE